MTKEDKELLFIDLCARLPYGVKIEVIEDNDFKDVEVLDCYYLDRVNNKFYSIKPYLFPLSSMTEEQKKELGEMGWILQSFGIINKRAEIITHSDCLLLINWLIRNNFDFRGLIPKGLAIDATGKGIY
jgi:hypothetical protein